MGKTLLQQEVMGGLGVRWFTKPANAMDHTSCLTCLTPSSSLCMMPTSVTGAPCNPSDPLQLSIIFHSSYNLPFTKCCFSDASCWCIYSSLHIILPLLILDVAPLKKRPFKIRFFPCAVSTKTQWEFFFFYSPSSEPPVALSTAPSLHSH